MLTPTGFYIYDKDRKYIDRPYATKVEADRELRALLQPYPSRHEWRERLHVVERRGDDGALRPVPKGAVPSARPNASACRRCSECLGEEHHWLPDGCDFADNEPGHPAAKAGHTEWVPCKHCEAWRPYTEEDHGF